MLYEIPYAVIREFNLQGPVRGACNITSRYYSLILFWNSAIKGIAFE